MKKAALLVIGIAALAILLSVLRRALRSDEDRIRDLLGAMAGGFNASSASGAMAGLDESFREETAGASRDEVHQFLAWLFLTQRDPKTKDFRFRVELEDVQVTLGPERRSGDVKLRATLRELRGGEFRPAWEVEVDASLEKKDAGWRVPSSRHKVLSGKRPF